MFNNKIVINMNVKILTVLMLVVLVFGSTGSIEKQYNREKPNYNVIDKILQEKLKDTDENIEVIIQFNSPVSDKELELLDKLNFEVKSKFTIINGVCAVGSKDGILKLSNYKNILWIEYNEPLEYSMYDTTKVINATEAWTRIFQDRYGNYLEKRVKGEGVCAVILDTGVDAGHPDFDYGSKTVTNLKRVGANQWVEEENADTSSGHGTHCAGTAVGNGDASAGRMFGVAPEASLIGLGVGDGLSIYYALEGLEWVYQHSKPNANPYNIRVVSNSWGTSGSEYDPEDGITKAAEKLAWENNVATIFAAGNSGGDGSDIQTNPYSNIPVAIGVAAINRDGKNMAGFSSRGDASKEHTWPDITAPGGVIWSAAGRNTVIDYSQRATDQDVYYMEISGTSMATPHIAGVTALLFQVAPHLQMSYIHDDYSGDDNSTWFSNELTRIHEVELIMEMSATFLSGGEGIPGEYKLGVYGHPHDFVQGYGLVNVDMAVGLAATLEEMRTLDEDGDGIPDILNVTVFDAFVRYLNVSTIEDIVGFTDTLKTSWEGDWGYFQDQSLHQEVYATDQSHYLFMPNGSVKVLIDFEYQQMNRERNTIADVDLACDIDGDGINDITPSTDIEGEKHYEIDVSADMTGKEWRFWTDGSASGIDPLDEYAEPIVPYSVSLQVIFDLGSNISINLSEARSYNAQLDFGKPSSSYSLDNGSAIIMSRRTYKLSEANYVPEVIIEEKEEEDNWWIFGVVGIAAVACIVVGVIFMKKRKMKGS